MYKVLFVCTGNICRSPTAEAVLKHRILKDKLQGLETDSAGTHGYHIGEAPDQRTVAVASERGIAMDSLRARKLVRNDFYNFNLILGLDKNHVSIIKNMMPTDATAEAGLFLEYAKGTPQDVPDPYYGKRDGFIHVLDLVEDGIDALILKLKSQISI